jgi:CRISPR-associated protein Cas5t
MPPPATIYGHLAGVLGEWFEPRGLEFSYVFEHAGKGVDIETGHPIELGSGKTGLKKRGWDHPINVVCAPNPQKREFLLCPKMTLYLRGATEMLEGLRSAFLSPRFSYILGRSQDLATLLGAEMTELTLSSDAFFSHTLLPYTWRPWVLPGSSVALPAAIDYAQQRTARQERYLQIVWPALLVYPGTRDTIRREELPVEFVVDPTDRRMFGEQSLLRGLHFHPVLNR